MASDRRQSVEDRLERWLGRCGVGRVVEPRRAVRLLEFTAVGVTGIAVNVAVFLGAVPYTHFAVAGTGAFFVSVSWNFGLNRVVTFDRPDGDVTRQYLRYMLVHVVGFAVYLGMLAVTIAVLAFPYLVADLVAVTLGGVFNFMGAEIYAFAMHRRD